MATTTPEPTDDRQNLYDILSKEDRDRFLYSTAGDQADHWTEQQKRDHLSLFSIEDYEIATDFGF